MCYKNKNMPLKLLLKLYISSQNNNVNQASKAASSTHFRQLDELTFSGSRRAASMSKIEYHYHSCVTLSDCSDAELCSTLWSRKM